MGAALKQPNSGPPKDPTALAHAKLGRFRAPKEAISTARPRAGDGRQVWADRQLILVAGSCKFPFPYFRLGHLRNIHTAFQHLCTFFQTKQAFF
jgi:hypothetical protein